MICFEYDPQTPYWGLKDAVSFQIFIFREYVLAPNRGLGVGK